jgi:hypothetical protein
MYMPLRSKTYVSDTIERFHYVYADSGGTSLSGFMSKDIVQVSEPGQRAQTRCARQLKAPRLALRLGASQLGPYYDFQRFGCITDASNREFDAVDGILGAAAARAGMLGCSRVHKQARSHVS